MESGDTEFPPEKSGLQSKNLVTTDDMEICASLESESTTEIPQTDEAENIASPQSESTTEINEIPESVDRFSPEPASIVQSSSSTPDNINPGTLVPRNSKSSPFLEAKSDFKQYTPVRNLPEYLYTNEGYPLPIDLDYGYRLLREWLTNKKFINYRELLVNPPEYSNYMKVHCPPPIFLNEMADKYLNMKYSTVTEFIRDIRIMLETIIIHNSAHENHPDIKKLIHVDTVLTMRINQWPKDVRSLCTVAMTNPETTSDRPTTSRSARRVDKKTSFVSERLSSIRAKNSERKLEELRLQQEKYYTEICDWEEGILTEENRKVLNASWEIPQIGLFLHLCKSALCIGEISIVALERAFLIPFQSEMMNIIMSKLLGTPFQRSRNTLGIYPRYWHPKLTHRLHVWYKFLEEYGDLHYTAERLGISVDFFHICGRLRSPLTDKLYSDLTLYQRIWIVKSLCDHFLWMQPSLTEAIDTNPAEDSRELLIGVDNSDCTYITFMQFLSTCIRVYKCKNTIKKQSRKERTPKTITQSPRSATPVQLTSVKSEPEDTNNGTGMSARALRLARRSEIAHYSKTDTPVRKSATKRKGRIDDETIPIVFKQEPVTFETDSMRVEIHQSDDTSALMDLSDPNETGQSTAVPATSGAISESSPRETAHKSSENSEGLKSDQSYSSTTGDQPIIDQERTIDETEQMDTDAREDNSSRFVTAPPSPKEQPANETTHSETMVEANSETSQLVQTLQDSYSEMKQPPAAQETIESKKVPLEPEVELITEPEDLESFQLVAENIEQLEALCAEFENSSHKREIELRECLVKLPYPLWTGPPSTIQIKSIENAIKRHKDHCLKNMYKFYRMNKEYPLPNIGSAREENKLDEFSDNDSGSDTGGDNLQADCVLDKDDAEYKPLIKTKHTTSPHTTLIEVENKEGTSEFGVSAFGRIRKRRLIPNNSEEHVFIPPKRAYKQTNRSKTSEETEAQVTDVQTQTQVNATGDAKPFVISMPSAAPTNAAAVVQKPAPAKCSRALIKPESIPRGCSLVKIRKELYLVETSKLPALLNQAKDHVTIISSNPEKTGNTQPEMKASIDLDDAPPVQPKPTVKSSPSLIINSAHLIENPSVGTPTNIIHPPIKARPVTGWEKTRYVISTDGNKTAITMPIASTSFTSVASNPSTTTLSGVISNIPYRIITTNSPQTPTITTNQTTPLTINQALNNPVIKSSLAQLITVGPQKIRPMTPQMAAQSDHRYGLMVNTNNHPALIVRPVRPDVQAVQLINVPNRQTGVATVRGQTVTVRGPAVRVAGVQNVTPGIRIVNMSSPQKIFPQTQTQVRLPVNPVRYIIRQPTGQVPVNIVTNHAPVSIVSTNQPQPVRILANQTSTSIVSNNQTQPVRILANQTSTSIVSNSQTQPVRILTNQTPTSIVSTNQPHPVRILTNQPPASVVSTNQPQPVRILTSQQPASAPVVSINQPIIISTNQLPLSSGSVNQTQIGKPSNQIPASTPVSIVLQQPGRQPMTVVTLKPQKGNAVTNHQPAQHSMAETTVSQSAITIHPSGQPGNIVGRPVLDLMNGCAVVSGQQVFKIHNGPPLMTKIGSKIVALRTPVPVALAGKTTSGSSNNIVAVNQVVGPGQPVVRPSTKTTQWLKSPIVTPTAHPITTPQKIFSVPTAKPQPATIITLPAARTNQSASATVGTQPAQKPTVVKVNPQQIVIASPVKQRTAVVSSQQIHTVEVPRIVGAVNHTVGSLSQTSGVVTNLHPQLNNASNVIRLTADQIRNPITILKPQSEEQE